MFPNHKKEQLIIGILIIVGLIATLVSKSTSDTVAPVQKVEKVTTLGINFPTFREKYNEQVSRYEVPQLHIKAFATKKENGKETNFCYFGDSIGLSIETDEEKNVVEVTAFSEPDKGGRTSIELQTIAFDSVIAVFEPALTPEKRKNIIGQLSKNIKHCVVYSDNFKYESKLYNDILMFSVKPKG